MKKLFTLFSLLLISISGMLAANIANNTVIYFDATAYTDIQQSIASGKKLQMLLGHSSWSQGYQLTAVEGYENLYSVKMPNWDGCTQLAFMTVDSQWGGEGNSVSNRVQWGYTKTPVYSITSNMSGNVGFAGNPLTRTNNYTLPVKAPKITVAAAPEFATTTVGETSTVTVTYTVENSEEKPEISLDNDAFTAEDAGGTITITFAPTEAKEYTATLTIAIGDIKETVDLVATGVAADAPKVPEILNLKAGEISAIYVGETTEFEVTYTLQNAEEATASIEGEGFTIKKQEVGTATIEFAPTEAKTYEAVVTVTSGDVNKTLEISATAKKAPVVITISFVNPDWEEAALYAWVEGGENLTGGKWPGKPMTKDETTGIFSYALTIPEDGVYSFIINNNNNGLQSVDMEGVTESTCYNLGAKVGDNYSLVVSENCEYTPAPEPEPIDPYVAIRGTMTNWEMASDIKMTYNADAANGPEWYITAFEVPADGKFKVVSVDAQSQTTWYGSDKVDLQEGITNANADQGDADIALPAGKYDIYFKVNEGRIWIQKYVAPEEPEKPELNVSAEEVVFDELTLGEEPVSATETIKYEIKNSDEAAVIELESDVFKAEDENGTITITFAPETEGEYTAELTITLGEIVKTIAISGSAKAAVDPEPDPEPATQITITYVNTEGYENVDVHAWGGTASATTWPGQQLTATGNQINGYDTYSFTFEEGAYTQCLFNCGGANPDACKTSDQTIDASKTYFSKGTWYATAEEIPAEVPDVWTVVGDAGLFETAWDFGNTAYDMTEGEAGIFTLVKEDVALEAKAYEYKFVQNRSWSGAQYPKEGNYTLNVAEAASYKVTYTLDTKAGNGTCTIEKVTSPEPDPDPEPTPEITVSETEVDFGEITVGEQANKEVTYTYKDTEKPEISLVGNGFSYTDNEESIIITFAPVDAGEYEGTLTVGKAELAKTITLKGTAKAAVVPEPEKPELIVSTEELVFETLILDGEQFSSTETITYEIKNSDEAAVIALESEDDVFEAIDEDGTITITFTPIFNNYLYKAELTITLGDIVKTVAISAVVKPLIDDILLPEFDDTKVGEYDEIEVLYSLHKGNEGVARIEGDPAFEITSQEVGRMFIKFTPLEVREYTATLIITSGKFEREITLIANGIAPDPEPTDITFTVQVPEGTKECWIAGTPGWTFIQMEKVDGEENLFSITVEKTVLNGEEWKYASGANWQYAEVIEGNGNRTEAEDPYDVVTAWQKLYDPDFQPIDPYYAIRGLNGDASWTGSGDIKLEESADASEWVALGFTVAEGESFKVIYIDENAKVSGYYAGLEDGCDVGQSYDDMGNLVLPAGTYNLYFKPDTELMWISKVDTPTDAEEAIAELIYAVDGTIIAPAPFAIIDLAGKDVTNANGSLQGTYIVKTLNSTAKISVK